MSDYDSGFARAQAMYDAQTPPEQDECPTCDGAEFDDRWQDCPHGFYGGQDPDDAIDRAMERAELRREAEDQR